MEVKKREGQGEREKGKSKRKPEKKRKEERKMEEEPDCRWEKLQKVLWLFLSKGHSMAMGSALLVGLVHDYWD